MAKVDKQEYNCGGFALAMKKWVTPYTDDPREPDFDEDEREENCRMMYEQGSTREEVEDWLLDNDVGALLHKFPWLRIVDPALYPAPYPLIAYRVFAMLDEDEELDTDFHFIRRIGHHWYQKSGTSEVTQCDELMGSDRATWYIYDADLEYTSDIVYFIDMRRTVYKNLQFSQN